MQNKAPSSLDTILKNLIILTQIIIDHLMKKKIKY
jgi:hypothetical protein